MVRYLGLVSHLSNGSSSYGFLRISLVTLMDSIGCGGCSWHLAFCFSSEDSSTMPRFAKWQIPFPLFHGPEFSSSIKVTRWKRKHSYGPALSRGPSGKSVFKKKILPSVIYSSGRLWNSKKKRCFFSFAFEYAGWQDTLSMFLDLQ